MIYICLGKIQNWSFKVAHLSFSRLKQSFIKLTFKVYKMVEFQFIVIILIKLYLLYLLYILHSAFSLSQFKFSNRIAI